MAIERAMGWVNLQQATRVVESAVGEKLQAAVGLSWAEFELLWRLSMAGDHPLRMSDIAGQLMASPSGITRIADRLEKDGLIARQVPKDNRRVIQINLTPRGRKTLGVADAIFRSSLEEAFSDHLSETDVRTLRRILRKVLEGNGAWAVERCEPGAHQEPAA